MTEIVDDPSVLTSRLTSHVGPAVVFRPLVRACTDRREGFLRSLSVGSRRPNTFDGYDLATASELCDATARYDLVTDIARRVAETHPSSAVSALRHLASHRTGRRDPPDPDPPDTP
ncbi:hypothetical protein ACFUJ0_15220 [Streptomyces sp. NPDC057242]|uniref:hypothetical protein n=1 Tax=unclassified Streptomyces TaxID=2593676 RepID=UPI00362E7525